MYYGVSCLVVFANELCWFPSFTLGCSWYMAIPMTWTACGLAASRFQKESGAGRVHIRGRMLIG